MLHCITEIIQVTEGRKHFPRKLNVGQPYYAASVNNHQAHVHAPPHHHTHPNKHHTLIASLITAVRYLYIRHRQLS